MPDSPYAGLASDLASLWSSEYGRVRDSRRRIEVCGQWRRQEVLPHVPPEWSNPAAFQIMLPHAVTLSQDVANFLGRKTPAIRRVPLGQGPTAGRTASKVELWASSAMDALRTNGESIWDAIIAAAVHDGEFAVLVSPRPAYYGSLLSFTGDGPDQTTIAPTFQRDSKGRTADDAYYQESARRSFKPDERTSAAAYEQYALDAKARRLPFVVRVIPAAMCVPLGVGPDGNVDALLIRSERTALSLRREGFEFTALSTETAANAGLLGGGPGNTAGAVFTLYELHTPGTIQYQIGGRDGGRAYATTLRGAGQDGATATIDLAKEYGLTDVPGGYFYGAHFANETDPNKRGVPFLFPFISLLKGANQTITAEVAHMHNFAFGGWFIKPDRELVSQNPDLWTEQGKPRQIDIQPMKAQYVVGDPVPAVHPGVNKDAGSFLNTALGLLDALSPSNTLKSGSDASGFAQGVGLAAAEQMLSQTLEGAQHAWKRVAECLLEQASSLSTTLGAPIPVYSHTKPDGTQQDHVLLSADDLQGDWSVEVYVPQRKGQNLALAQAGSVWVQAGLLSHSTWLQDMFGDEQPEAEQDRIWVEKQLASPEGQQYVLQLAAKYQGNQEMEKLYRLQQQGQVTQGGTPSAMLPPRPSASGRDGVSGPNTGNPAASAVAGIMSGVSQTASQAPVIAATGQPAPVAAF